MTCPACGHGQKVQPSVGIELEARGGSYGELDSGTAVREDPHGRYSSPARPAGYRPASSPASSAASRARGRDEVEDELADSDPIVSYRKARDMLDVTVADTPTWRGRHDATDAGEKAGKSATLQLRQGNDIFEVPDLATLQRWIMERRVEPDDELPDGSGGWLRAGDRPDLAVFFMAMEQLESYDGPAAPPQPQRRPQRPPAQPVRPRRREDTDDDNDDHTVEAVAPLTEEHPYPIHTPASPPPALELNTRPMISYEDDSPTELLNTSVDGIRLSAPPLPLASEHLIVDSPAPAGKDVTTALRGVVRAPQHAPVVAEGTATSALQLVGAMVVIGVISLAGLWWFQQEPQTAPVQVILQPSQAPTPGPAPAPAALAPTPAAAPVPVPVPVPVSAPTPTPAPAPAPAPTPAPAPAQPTAAPPAAPSTPAPAEAPAAAPR